MRIIATEDELERVSHCLIEAAEDFKVIVFRGDLGAGKTTLIKNMCKLLGVKDAIRSPTFSIVNEYKSADNEGIFHFDFYRLNREEEAYDIGAEEYFYSGKLCLIEWPSKIESLLPKKRIEVHILLAEKGREFTINQIS
ncbi:MAG: tRNA threonylcarbamoyladenosine biosynthesis protein TsaE [Vicingaceae bacterium]|jgi:tRNA threonylcarbamoyladenosine biosynthesis protein TsaE